jgi:serine/threonine-protein kinase
MSPEQAGGKKTDKRSDLYAIGVVAFELLTGERPFFSDQAIAILRMHLEDPPPHLQGFSAELDAVLQRALTKSPDDRWQTADAFAQALAETPEAQAPQRAATPLPIPVAPRAATVQPRARTQHHHQQQRSGGGMGMFLLVAAVLGGAGIVGWMKFGPHKSDAATATTEDTPITLDGAKTLITRGDREGALRVLHELRRRHPKDAQVAMLLGDLYFDKHLWHESVAAYEEAVTDDPSLKSNAHVNQQVIETLADAGTRDHTRTVIVNRLGAAALPFLKIAAKNHKDPNVRQACTALIATLST